MSKVFIYFLLSLPLVGAFAMFALGIVVVHRASKVLNLAHGAMAMVPAFVAYSLVQASVPAPIAVVTAVAAGAAIGVAIERVFVRSLRREGPTAQTVGTVAALGLILGVAIKIWGTTPRIGIGVFPEGGLRIGASTLRYGQIGLFGVAMALSVALFALFRFTDIGLAMRAAADNRRAASLMGVNPDRTTSLAWAVGGALAGVAGVLLAPVTVLHPINLTLLVLPAFVAALIGGLDSLPGAVGGAAIVGVVQGMVPAISLVPGVGGFATQVGAPQLVLTILALVVMAARGRRLAAGDMSAEIAAPRARAERPDRGVAASRRRRPIPRPALALVLGAALLAWPFLGTPYSVVGDAVQAGITLLVVASLVMLTGWVGQISLAQASLVGIGAFTTALLSNRIGLQFPLNLPVSALVSAAVAAGLGLVALRVRGLYLAVATLIFLWMSNEYLFRSSWLVGAGGSARIDVRAIGREGAFPYFDFSERRTFYYVVLAVAAAALWGLSNLRDSKTGRAFFAVRGSETAAASLGIDVTRTKLLAFALSGLLAGVAGNLLVVGQGAASPSQFGFNASLFYVAVAVVGGVASLGGAVGASILFAALGELFFRVSALSGWLDVVGAGLLALVLLAYPGGLAGVPASLERRAALAGLRPGLRPGLRRERRPEPAAPAPEGEPPPKGERALAVKAPAATPALPAARDQRRPLLEASDVTVRFGGLTAVDNVSLSVREGEIAGLIGPNGAGKTTMFNAISGLTAAGGSVRLFGRDVTAWPVHRRAALGVARTFQVVQLFGELSIFDNLLVATHLQNPTGALAHVAVTAPALAAERAARARVRSALATLGLESIAQRRVTGLPLGTLRMVEVARALVTGAPLVMLDEPASGLDNAETDRLAGHLRAIRSDLGVSILLIEHDVRMVTGVCDYIYVLDRGRLLAEGRPEEIRRHDRVVAAYLGEEPVAARA